AWTSTVWETRSTWPTRSIRDRSRITAPARACAPPHTPEPAPRGITAVPVSVAQASTVATSCVLAGKTTAAGAGSSSPRTRRSRSSVHESMARSRPTCASVLTVPAGRRLTRRSTALTTADRRPAGPRAASRPAVPGSGSVARGVRRDGQAAGGGPDLTAEPGQGGGQAGLHGAAQAADAETVLGPVRRRHDQGADGDHAAQPRRPVDPHAGDQVERDDRRGLGVADRLDRLPAVHRPPDHPAQPDPGDA